MPQQHPPLVLVFIDANTGETKTATGKPKATFTESDNKPNLKAV